MADSFSLLSLVLDYHKLTSQYCQVPRGEDDPSGRALCALERREHRPLSGRPQIRFLPRLCRGRVRREKVSVLLGG